MFYIWRGVVNVRQPKGSMTPSPTVDKKKQPPLVNANPAGTAVKKPCHTPHREKAMPNLPTVNLPHPLRWTSTLKKYNGELSLFFL